MREVGGVPFGVVQRWLLSHANEAFDPMAGELAHDMTQPLPHYWCASSHNTYLEVIRASMR